MNKQAIILKFIIACIDTCLLVYLIFYMFILKSFRIQPSVDCGPFQGYDRPYKVINTTDTIGELPDWTKDALDYIGTPAVFFPILILLM